MTEVKTPNSDSGVDVEKQDNERNVVSEENNEPLEKAKVKRIPAINGSLVMLYAVFFSMSAIGLINLNNCSHSRLIPIYLIVAGFVGAMAKFTSKFTNKHLFNLAVALAVFYVVWHCLGTYWVYKEYQPNYDYRLGKYCDRTTFLLAFWILTLQYTVAGFVFALSACYMLMKGDFKKI